MSLFRHHFLGGIKAYAQETRGAAAVELLRSDRMAT